MSTVLVVEDHVQIRYLLRTILESSGYSVVEAADGNQAITACADCPPDVLLCDFLLPDMKANDLIPIALKSNPKLKVLVMSGHSENAIRQTGISKRYRVIAKPFNLSDVVRLVEEALHPKLLTMVDEQGSHDHDGNAVRPPQGRAKT